MQNTMPRTRIRVENLGRRASAIVHRAGPVTTRIAVCTFIFPSSDRVVNGFATAGDRRIAPQEQDLPPPDPPPR
jgi:hypothetical protein